MQINLLHNWPVRCATTRRDTIIVTCLHLSGATLYDGVHGVHLCDARLPEDTPFGNDITEGIFHNPSRTAQFPVKDTHLLDFSGHSAPRVR